MCSIIGCRWTDHMAPMLVRGLKKMEYRGYDSVGVASIHGDKIELKKGVGRVEEVNKALSLDAIQGNSGIGHTRWATHGGVSALNAHPHLDTVGGRVAVVHNGIIENYEEIKRFLGDIEFKSETDTESIANLLGYYFNQTNDAKCAMEDTLAQLKGNYAFIALFNNGCIAAARNHEPLILGIAPLGYFLSSDVLGFIEYTDDAIYLESKEFVVIDPAGVGGYRIYEFDGKQTDHKIVKLSKEFADVYKHEYAHFTLKEIHEQKHTVKVAGEKYESEILEASKLLWKTKQVYFTGSGTSYNAAMVGRYWLGLSGKKVEPIISSESQFLNPVYNKNSLLLAISQSGESADVLETVRAAKAKKCPVISLVNTMTSSLAGLSDIAIGLGCGPEIGVAATKSFTSQLSVLDRIVKFPGVPVHLKFAELSEKIGKILNNTRVIQDIAAQLRDVTDIYVLGRGVHYPIASEVALKLKELAYIHAEGIPGGELKHGPLALMDDQVFVILINPNDQTYGDTFLSAKQIKARGAKIIGVSQVRSELYDYWIEIPDSETKETFPFLEIIPLQLLAYYVAIEKETNPDYPRNLAKSCTTK